MSASVMAMRSGLLADWARAAPGASVMSVASRQRRDNAQNLVGGMACAPVRDGDRRARRKRRASMTQELHEASALELARRLDAGEITAERIVEACLARIAAREPTVRAWIHLDRDGALAMARQLDRGGRRGLLHAIPMGVKDIIDTADQPTGYGSPHLPPPPTLPHPPALAPAAPPR